jgi:hypothetical protein
MDGLDIVRRVLTRLRRPSDRVLPYQVILDTVAEVIASKRLDLVLSDQNNVAVTSEWFTPSYQDFELSDMGIDNVMLPIRLERRSQDSEFETGEQVPIVSYEVLETSLNGAVAFYGSPLRISFRDTTEYVIEQQYRLIYEEDFTNNVALNQRVELPEYFAAMIGVEAAYLLIDLIEDTSPEFTAFMKSVTPKMEAEIVKWNFQWTKFANRFPGKAVVPKRTFLQSHAPRPRTRYFRG